MVKMKPEEKDLDLVITGAEYGTGKRSGWMSSFILSCKNNKELQVHKNTKKNNVSSGGRGFREKKGKKPMNLQFVEIGKVGTGIAEKDNEITFESLTKLLTPLITKEKGKTVQIKPKIIVAVTYQEIQKSPNYNSGWALRFPRFTALRPDKPISEITTLEEIEKDFANQKRNWKYG
jgi:DNA ligase-1